MKYYHNKRCSTSRKGLALLEEKGITPEIVDYMNEPITPDELSAVLTKLGIEPIALVRTKEKVWKEEFADKELSNDEVLFTMIEYPQLMERPILVNGDKAKVGRPIEDLLEIV